MSATPDSTLADPRQIIADLKRELDECRVERDKAQRTLDERTTERDEALAQQAATAEVLQVINASPGDVAPVFDAVLERATRLCQAASGLLWTYDGEYLHPAALRGVPPAFADYSREPFRPHPEMALGRVLLGAPLIVDRDLAATELYQSRNPLRRAIVELGRAHSAVTVALRKDDALLGIFTIYRQRSKAIYRQGDRPVAKLRGTSGHRDGERAALD
jgi:hypothetical protein